MKKILLFFVAALCLGAPAAPQCVATQRIVIVSPNVHKALQMIESGITENWQGKGKIVSFNAFNNSEQMQSIFNSIADGADDVAAVLAIGKSSAQQAIKTINKNIPVIGVAADIETKDLGGNACCVVDEISPQHLVRSLRALLPRAKRIALVIANVEKSLSVEDIFTKTAQAMGFEVQTIVVDSLSDITIKVSSSVLKEDTAAIVLLKDHLTVSAVPQFLKVCGEVGAILATSDEGSVIAGAHFGVGVSEYNIGKKSALIGSRILQGDVTPPEVGRSIPEAAEVSLYINEKWAKKQGSACGGNMVDIEGLKNSSGLSVQMR